MKIIYFFLILFLGTIQIHSADKCTKLDKKQCKTDSKCRWSKPNKACVANFTASTSNQPTNSYNTKDGSGLNSRKACNTIKEKSECSKGSRCLWNETSSVCAQNPNAPIEQSTSSHPPAGFNPTSNK